MLAMQYSFTLPADYDMGLIEQRIRDNGHRLNGFEGLEMKFYLYARRDDPVCASDLNLYAPLYLWRSVEGINRFLTSEGFAALCEHFGRPAVDIWLVEQVQALGSDAPAFATRRISPYSGRSAGDVSHMANPAQLIANDYRDWRRLQLTLTEQPPDARGSESQHYRIGYIARG